MSIYIHKYLYIYVNSQECTVTALSLALKGPQAAEWKERRAGVQPKVYLAELTVDSKKVGIRTLRAYWV